MENVLRDNEHGIKVLAGVCAAIFALVQYFDHLENARVARTLEFYKQFSSEPIYSSRLKVVVSWEALWNELKNIPVPNNETEKAGVRSRWKRIVVDRIGSDAELAASTEAVFEFFNALQVCVENEICDKNAAYSLLGYQAEEFVGNNCPYIGFVRYDRSNATFAEKANIFARSRCDASIYKN